MKEIVIPILNNEYKVIVVWGKDKFIEKVAKSWGYDNFTIDRLPRRGRTYYHARCHPIIQLNGKPKTPEEMGTLAHEATHAVNNIWGKLDETVYDEAFAHSIGAIVREVLKFKERKKSKKLADLKHSEE